MRTFGRSVLFIGLILVAGLGLFGNRIATSNLAATDKEGAAKLSYAKDIKPILTECCYGCHNAKKMKAKVDLQSGFAGVSKIVKPEKPAESRLFKCLIGKEAKLMPPKNPLPEETIGKIKAWIEAGAKDN